MQQDLKLYAEMSEIFKMLSHPTRLCIMHNLVKNGSCNVSHMQQCLTLPQATVSQHLQKLRAAGFVTAKRTGLEVEYFVVNENLKYFIKQIFKERVRVRRKD